MLFLLLVVVGPSLCLAVTRVEVVKSWSAVVTEVSKSILEVLLFVLLQSFFWCQLTCYPNSDSPLKVVSQVGSPINFSLCFAFLMTFLFKTFSF